MERSEVRLIHRPGAVQSSLAIGHIGVSRKIPDLLAAAVLLGRFGAGMGSRINYRLREEKGYTYAAGEGRTASKPVWQRQLPGSTACSVLGSWI